MDVYTPRNNRNQHTDGAYFGTGFPHMFFFVHPEARPDRPEEHFVPRWTATYFLFYLKNYDKTQQEFLLFLYI